MKSEAYAAAGDANLITQVVPTPPAAKIDLGGTFRARDAASTLAWVRPLLPRFGITRVANVTGLDRIGIPVWMCIRPNGRSLSVSQGKGLSDELAQASAVMESIECHHAEHLPPPCLAGSYRTVRRRHEAVSPRRLQAGIRWKAYDDSRPIAWTRGIDLATREDVLVPHVRLDLDWSRSHPDAGIVLTTSTGLASGNTRAEALCHGLFEVVERDSEWRWRRLSEKARHASEIRTDSIEAAMLRGLLERFDAARVSVSVWDMTSPVGIPVYYCSIGETDPFGAIRLFGGSGCHFSKEIALARALTEAAQSRLTFIAGSRDDLFPPEYDPSLQNVPDTRSHVPTLDFGARSSQCSGRTFDDDIATALDLLREAGFPRVVAVDHTRSEFGIPVVSVVVPGMRETETD
jgi:ribosomal protein S12 methylthiotransferase accessory factor